MSAEIIILAHRRRIHRRPEPGPAGNPMIVVWVAMLVSTALLCLASCAWWAAGGAL